MSQLASSGFYILTDIVFVNEIKQYKTEYFPCVSLAESCSSTLGDDLEKNDVKLIILGQYFLNPYMSE